jgi:predicted DNA-binding transcriptional regulator AlpA
MDDQGEFITAGQAIEKLGVSRATFYNYARQLERFRRVGDRRVLYRASDVEAMAEIRPVPREDAVQPPVIYKPRRRTTSRQQRAKN